MNNSDQALNDWRSQAHAVEEGVSKVVIGQERAIRSITIALFTRGHVLLEGDVGVGKTTLLRAVARAIGGDYARIEGAIDLMPNDLIYYTYLNEQGKPCVDPGPILQHGESLATFFFNEINRARPQVHSLLLRVMAERSIQAFNREFHLPHLQVFADRNRLEKEETFELPSAARDRFLMELTINTPTDTAIQRELMVNPRFHDIDALVEEVPKAIVQFDELNGASIKIQREINTSETLQNYVLNLCRASREPADFGMTVSDIDISRLVQAGVSPRGMSMLLRAGRTAAWLEGREHVMPEDIRSVFRETISHRIFLNPIHEMQRGWIMPMFIDAILQQVATP